MNSFHKTFLTTALIMTTTLFSYAQEFNARVQVNSSKLQGSQSAIFSNLENQLRSFVNDRKWTNIEFEKRERIDATITLIIEENLSSNLYKAELQIVSKRPVYNSSYTTTLLNHRDRNLSFEYVDNKPLEFSESNLSDNLTATVAFYLYLILGLEMDSMSQFGGTTYYKTIHSLSQSCQGNNWDGWDAISKSHNRFSIAELFNDERIEPYREMWYEYHRLGLDMMASSPIKGREAIIATLPKLSETYFSNRNSPIATLFGDAKLAEVANIYTEATDFEKDKGYEMLSTIFPTHTQELEKIKKRKR